ncbi:MAG: hypothetical protein UV05_C0044G0008 [candidate division CPR1 bacterium GW2011_GWA2_42_17]|uniref:Uncharacterized protein n=1 Tax=candidate division CPR1 bacterium GW2011_GWA2_42_17 TaxID=1618341 RepID=A0A0G0Z0U7_9BACT|nr:MAG: hypothetical protein UV05_C0044G0008 [candidate division CPR1 bacterium GW2011_GWA2_42_17]
MSSSEVVKILNIQTRVSFRIFLMGFRNGSPLNFRNAARFARVECQVQSEDFLSERFFERETGVEPATFSLARRRSTTELLPRGVEHSAEGQNWTADARIFSPSLYH